MKDNGTGAELSLADQTFLVLKELAEAGKVGQGKVLVVGGSTSEVAGARIGTSGALEVAEQLLAGVRKAAEKFEFTPVYQCCEHLNRALVMERSLLERLGLSEVSAVPIPGAGGSLGAAAYNSMDDPVLAESVQAHAGIDIGETLIGMHLRRVAVPFRPSLRYIGEARVNAAYTRPPLIGGERAVYAKKETSGSRLCD
ncbi:TIGR01440 family protein [Paenibacillus sp. HN-1]|uniref:TIGR01440 family protein n=1 Tax=Paenibacillus TaxID=44249 RepID=UPI001CAA3D92|nr:MULTISPECIES: TIGR01440 family protein [Paenibacillus]MBY9077655.1 TIGR01440 family protein [Paenibacillus sp. CGMCC 1.18879]MBY9087420.1 TIGR01440 family protein [Paenibacillus sinensis]